jgi:hypothetical protein
MLEVHMAITGTQFFQKLNAFDYARMVYVEVLKVQVDWKTIPSL